MEEENQQFPGYHPWDSQEEKDFEYSILDDYYNELDQEREANKAITNEILNPLKSEKSEEWFKDLMDYAKEAETHNPFKIVEKPKGQWQEEGCYESLGGVWVEQSSPYPCEDCYYGTVTVKIDEKRYLEMPFSC